MFVKFLASTVSGILTIVVKYGMFCETQSKRLQKLHNRSARIIMNISNEVDQREKAEAKLKHDQVGFLCSFQVFI